MYPYYQTLLLLLVSYVKKKLGGTLLSIIAASIGEINEENVTKLLVLHLLNAVKILFLQSMFKFHDLNTGTC